MNEPEFFLDLDQAPPLVTCSFRRFDPGEYHVTRVSDSDVPAADAGGRADLLRRRKAGVAAAGSVVHSADGAAPDRRGAQPLPYYYYIHFRGSFSPESRHPLPLAGRFEPGEFLPLFRKIDAAWWADGSGVSRQGAFFDILSRLEEAAPANPVAGMIAYLSEHLEEELHLSDLAREFRYTEDHIIRLFRRWKGTTPHRCILELRPAESPSAFGNHRPGHRRHRRTNRIRGPVCILSGIPAGDRAFPGEWRSNIPDGMSDIRDAKAAASLTGDCGFTFGCPGLVYRLQFLLGKLIILNIRMKN